LRSALISLPAALISFLFSAVPAYADLKICNRMSYVVEAAIGIDDKAATATRGWFRIDPAACRVVAQGTLTADRILLTARAIGVYGSSPIPQSGGDTLCVAPDNFVIAAARQCRGGQSPAPFTQINPTQTDDGNMVAYLAEDSEYDDEQAKLAGIQRLLVIAGYDAAPIDGVDGPKTQAALAAFLKNRGMTADIVQSPNFFATMIDDPATAAIFTNGKSPCANASRTICFSRLSTFAAGSSAETEFRSGRKFKKHPITLSEPARVRLLATVPITRSCCDVQRESRIRSPLIITVNNVEPVVCDSAFSRCTVACETMIPHTPP